MFRIKNPDTLCGRITNAPEQGVECRVECLEFSRICNATAASISIFNAIKIVFRIKNPDTPCGRITNAPEQGSVEFIVHSS